jgi:hypothetical protein
MVLAVLIPLSFFLLSAIVFPRPYYVTEMDFEQDYYYNARMISEGIPLNVHHPGTPIYYLGHLLLSLTGSDPDASQLFFTLGYFLVAVATSASLYFFARLLFQGVPPSISLLSLVSIVVWPSFLTYSNYFGSDSFIVAAGLPTVALFWKTLERFDDHKTVELALCGIGIGLCLAIKMSFLPLAAALLVGNVVHAFLSVSVATSSRTLGCLARLRSVVSRLSPLFGGFVVSYFIFTVPIFGRLPLVWIRSFMRQDAIPPHWNLPAAIMETFKLVFSVSPFFIATLVLLLLLFASVVGHQIVSRRLLGRHFFLPGGGSPNGEEFDFFSGAIFLVLMMAGFAYVSAAAIAVTPGAETGVRLRNISPCALFIPFLLLYCHRYFRERISIRGFSHPAVSGMVFVLAVLVLISGWRSHFVHRQDIIDTHLSRISAVRQRLAALPAPGKRIAFWTQADQDSLGEISFHFWGNYRYARNHFDGYLLKKFPSFAFLKLRNIRQAMNVQRRGKQDNQYNVSLRRSRYGVVGDLYWKFREWILIPPVPNHWEIGGIKSEGVRGDQIAAIALTVSELDIFNHLSTSEEEAAELLRTYLGAGHVRKERIGGIEWVLMDMPQNAMKVATARMGVSDW